jgi:homoserine/homoserine lactone efflux protein
MTLELLATFIFASFLLAVTPGPTMSLVIANVTRTGLRAGLLTIAGSLTGLSILLTIVIFGLSSVIAFMAAWFDVIRLVGALYLIVLGLRALWALRQPATQALPVVDVAHGRFYVQGVFVALSNPKVLLFLGAFLPQFLNVDSPALPQLLILAAAFVATLGLVDCAYAIIIARAKRALDARWQRTMEGVSGALLVAAGIWLATTARRAA